MPMIAKFRPDEINPASIEIDPERVLEGSPRLSAQTFWRSADGTMTAGMFRSTPGTFTVESAGNESALVTTGRVRITAADGSVEEYAEGDVMTFQLGAKSTFVVLEDYEDYFVVSHPEGVKG
jgi:uncharacterized cupin superfamily protein